MFKKLYVLTLFAVVCVGNALASVTLPDVGVDVEGHATAMGTAIGAGVTVILGLVFAFMVVRRIIRWARGIG